VDYDNRIPESAIQAIRQARENGHLIYVCTGRSKAEMPQEIWDIGLDGMIGGNGSYVEHEGQVIMHQLIPLEVEKRVTEVLDLVGLKHKMRSFPDQLSGGEQQRVAIARAIVNNPQVLIADEPTGNLDPEISWEIMQLLERINLQGTTVLMATHNRQIVDTLRHRVVAIEDGRIVRDEEEGEYGYND